MTANRTTFYLLPRFLVLSTVLHACLFAGLWNAWRMAPNLHLGQSVLEIQLYDTALSPTQIAASTTVSDFPSAEKSVSHAITPRESIASSTPPNSANDAGAHAIASSAGTREGLYNMLLGALRTRLSQYLTYPPLARSRGWEGTVLLNLRVEPDGQLDKIRLERSSGFAVLDDSALNSLKRLGSIAEARVWLQERGFDMQLPVIYKLIDN